VPPLLGGTNDQPQGPQQSEYPGAQQSYPVQQLHPPGFAAGLGQGGSGYGEMGAGGPHKYQGRLVCSKI
jgi:hypothetical protein